MTLPGEFSQRVRLVHASFGTRNLERAVGFYRDVLGGEIAHEFRNEAGDCYGVFVHMGCGTFVELFRDIGIEAGATCTFRHICFDVPDIEAMAKHLTNHGFTPSIRRGRTDGVLQLFIEDMDGNKIEFQQQDEHSALQRFLADKQNRSADHVRSER